MKFGNADQAIKGSDQGVRVIDFPRDPILSGGAYPVAELRMFSAKNNRLCYIPEQLIIRDVEKVLNDSGDNDPSADPYYRDRARFGLHMLRQYAEALRQVRAAEGIFDPRFKNGM